MAAICGKCGRYGTVSAIRACALQGTPHEGEMAVPKAKWGFKVTPEDIDDAPDNGGATYEGELPPSGVYTFDAKFITKVKASTGSDMLSILWLINGKESGKKEFDGAPWWDNLVVTPQTMWKVKQFCSAVGIKSAEFLDMVVDDDGKVLKMGKLAVDKGVRLKASVTRKNNNNDELRLEFGRYIPKHSEDDAMPAGKKAAKGGKAGKGAGAKETPAEPAAASKAGKKGKSAPAAEAAPAGKDKAKAKAGKKAKGDEPPF